MEQVPGRWERRQTGACSCFPSMSPVPGGITADVFHLYSGPAPMRGLRAAFVPSKVPASRVVAKAPLPKGAKGQPVHDVNHLT
jgi:hypothetical protein